MYSMLKVNIIRGIDVGEKVGKCASWPSPIPAIHHGWKNKHEEMEPIIDSKVKTS